jgi:hypothetical protein
VRGRGPLPVGRGLRRLTGALLLGLVLLGALGVAARLAPGVGSRPAWELRRTAEPRRTGVFRDRSVDESSGVVASRRQPGLLWTLNDSGNDAWIYAADTLGRIHGAFEVTGARNVDWEAISLGPCPSGECLYIADTGDNVQGRRTSVIYRVAEPGLPSGRTSTARAEALEFQYSRGRWDVEAAFVDARGAVFLITKGRTARPRVYRLAPEAWKGEETATAVEVGRLPIDTGNLGNRVTDAALSPSGRTVAVRTYVAIYLFALGPSGSLTPSGVGCDAAGLQLQGEGISWLDERVLVLTSEGGFGTRGTIVLLQCGDSVQAT